MYFESGLQSWARYGYVTTELPLLDNTATGLRALVSRDRGVFGPVRVDWLGAALTRLAGPVRSKPVLGDVLTLRVGP